MEQLTIPQDLSDELQEVRQGLPVEEHRLSFAAQTNLEAP